MNGAEFLVRTLEREGVDVVFGYPGGAIMPVYDALIDAEFRHILPRHEQGAALAADGYARASGQVGVCLATSGPGATNLVTGLANAFLDSVPIVAITGQVPTPLMGTDAFQEVDIFVITMPIVKHSYLPRSGEELAWMLPEAFAVAQEGRPGPVLLDLPKDVALAEIVPSFRPQIVERSRPAYGDEELHAARRLLAQAERPVVYAGGGIGIGHAVACFREFVRSNHLPVVSTLKGLGSIPGDDPHDLGMLGMHGHAHANHAVQQADLLFVVGARFDDRATGKLEEFAPDARVVHLDIDAAELGKLRTPAIALGGPPTLALPEFKELTDASAWRDECRSGRVTAEDAPRTDRISGPAVIRALSERTRPGTTITCDVGQHQMWVAQHYAFDRPERHLTSGGLGTMGYGLPAAIGAQLARPDEPVIAVSGDGSIMMNLQELATIRRYGLPIKILLLDNACLGMVRQWQELFFEERLSEIDLSDNPDFVAVARCFDIDGETIESPEEVDRALDRLLATEGASLLHVRLNPVENVWPLVPPGRSNSEMLMGRE